MEPESTEATQVEVGPGWAQIDLSELRGTLLVVGGPDTGKSTFARYLYGQLAAAGRRAALLDGDPGQTALGPPTTMTLAMAAEGDVGFPSKGHYAQQWRRFVGATSPRGHVLPLMIGAARLVAAAQEAGAEAIVYDTCGLVDPHSGGVTLKLSKIDLLRPSLVFAIQRVRELEPLLAPLRLSHRTRLIELRPAPEVRRRYVTRRQGHRAVQFARYFADAGRLVVDWAGLPVWPTPRFDQGRLLALEDVQGFVRGLGIILESDPATRRLVLHTPLTSLVGVDSLRVGDLFVDPQSYRDVSVSQWLHNRDQERLRQGNRE